MAARHQWRKQAARHHAAPAASGYHLSSEGCSMRAWAQVHVAANEARDPLALLLLM